MALVKPSHSTKCCPSNGKRNWSSENKRSCQTDAITMHPSTSYEDLNLEGLRPTVLQPENRDTEQNNLELNAIKLTRKQGFYTHHRQ